VNPKKEKSIRQPTEETQRRKKIKGFLAPEGSQEKARSQEKPGNQVGAQLTNWDHKTSGVKGPYGAGEGLAPNRTGLRTVATYTKSQMPPKKCIKTETANPK